MDFQFVIPTSNSDLLNSNGNNYFVKQVYDSRELQDRLKAAKNAWASTSDPFYIFDHFDTLFSIIENSGTTSLINITRANDLMYLTIDGMGTLLNNQFKLNDIQNRNSLLNLTKMNLFLSIGIVRAIDQQIDKKQKSGGGGGVGGGANKKHNQMDAELHDWDSKRFLFVVQLYNIFNLPLEKLWNESIAEDDFVNMICEFCYRTLEMAAIKEKRLNDSIFQIFGLAIKRYNHALTFPIRILQLIRTCESCIDAIASGIHILYEEFELTTIFSVLLKDLVESLGLDAADSQTSRHYSKFLIELGTIAPKVIVPHLSILSEEMLNLESYILRNCILHIMGDVITCELSSEDLSEELKETRDEILDDLLNHMEDVSAHVRSKVIQIWNHIKTQNAVPLAYQHKVLEVTVERLDDRTCMVRKNAVVLIKTFLEMNPFAAKLPLEELKARYNKELDILNVIRQKLIDNENEMVELNKQWDEMAPDLFPFVQQELSVESQSSHVIPNNVDPEECQKITTQIVEALKEKSFSDAVTLVKRADLLAGNRQERMELTIEQQCAYYMQLLKSYMFINLTDHNEEFKLQDVTVKFLDEAIVFSEIIARAVPKIENMLLSKTITDVHEAIDFFTTAYLFGIKNTECGMRKILFLVWSGDKEKYEGASKAFFRILFVTDLEGRPHAIKVVDNLCNFLENITVGHYQAMEVLMKEWIESAFINNQVIQVLFERFTMKFPDTSENKSRLCLQLLVMASAFKPSIASANVDVLVSIGLTDRGLKNPSIFVSCINLLMNLAPNNAEYYKRKDSDNEMIEKIVKIYKMFFFYPTIDNFDEVTIGTFDFLYHLCSAPDILCQQLLHEICTTLADISNKLQTKLDTDTNKNELLETIEENTQASSTLIPASSTRVTSSSSTSLNVDDGTAPKWHLPLHLITRLIFLIGYVAMKEMIYLDVTIYNNMKYRQDLKEKKKQKNNKRKSTASINISSASNVLKRLSGTAAEPQQEPDEMLVGATAEDSIADLINEINEKELLYAADGILPKFIPLIMEILKSPAKYRDIHLQQTVCLTLIRFMSISSKFCEDNMPFLMNILNLSKNIKLKCNIIIGLSDFTFRYPNVIEPWTSHFYAILHEDNDELRLTVVKMLSHLISHEMIRVKGQISDLAMCILDRNEEICNITKQFFKEIANKSNILYNVLPDIISRLSDTNLNLEEEKYRQIMHYIIGLIHKDRQVETLVEKLCLRFRVTSEDRQWRDIAYCLSLLNYTEKTIRKLTENIQYFKDKVIDDEVYDSFRKIISQTSKLAKPELKAALIDFETKLEECLKVNDDGDNENGPVSGEENHRQSAAAASPSSSSSQSKRPSVGLMPPPSAIPSRSNQTGGRSKRGGRKITPNQQKTRTTNRRIQNQNSDDDSDDDFQQSTAVTGKSTTASTSMVRTQRSQRSISSKSKQYDKNNDNDDSDNDSDDDSDDDLNVKQISKSKRRGRKVNS